MHNAPGTFTVDYWIFIQYTFDIKLRSITHFNTRKKRPESDILMNWNSAAYFALCQIKKQCQIGY